MANSNSQPEAAVSGANGDLSQERIRELDRTVAELRAENAELRRQLLRHLFPQETAEAFDPTDYALVTPQEILADLDAIDAE